MIVGCREVDLKKLKSVYNVQESLDNYCISLVPKYVRHVKEIVDNQKYLVALYLRTLESIPFKEREYWSNYLTKDIHVTGLLNSIVDFKDLMLYTDVKQLVNFIVQEGENV